MDGDKGKDEEVERIALSKQQFLDAKWNGMASARRSQQNDA